MCYLRQLKKQKTVKKIQAITNSIQLSKDRLPLSGIFRAERHFPLEKCYEHAQKFATLHKISAGKFLSAARRS